MYTGLHIYVNTCECLCLSYICLKRGKWVWQHSFLLLSEQTWRTKLLGQKLPWVGERRVCFLTTYKMGSWACSNVNSSPVMLLKEKSSTCTQYWNSNNCELHFTWRNISFNLMSKKETYWMIGVLGISIYCHSCNNVQSQLAISIAIYRHSQFVYVNS